MKKIAHIDWETDNQNVSLPKEVEIPSNLIECNCSDWWECEINIENINNYLSEKYGFLVKGYNIK